MSLAQSNMTMVGNMPNTTRAVAIMGEKATTTAAATTITTTITNNNNNTNNNNKQ